MVQRRRRERSLFEVLLPDGHKLWPDWLRKIDTLLEDEGMIEVVAQGLEARWPESRRRGRLGTPAEVVLRMLILKHLFDWSYDDLEHEVRANLVYRAFTRIDAGDVPDAKTILKIARALGPEVIKQLHRQVVEVAKRAGGHARPSISHRHHGRRNECALSDRQLAVAGRRARADADDAARQCRVGRLA
jgi:IS5 family transposase